MASFTLPAEDIARRWLEECIHSHPQCGLSGGKPPLPTRVLDVGSEDSLESPRLYISGGKCERYATLSYCWGKLPISMRTTTNTLNACLSGIQVHEFPATIRDAVNLTRALGIRYLWVDVMCIIQDSKEDWETESALMASTYQHSVVTIVASIARDVYEGCSPYRNKLALAPCVVASRRAALSIQNRGRHVLYDKPVDRRGWTFQESQLGPRLLHCGGEQLSWECLTDLRSEVSPLQRVHPTTPGSYFFRPPVSTQGFRDLAKRQRQSNFAYWYQMVERYSDRALTYAGDKLPGIAGLADHFWNTFHTEYHDHGLQYLCGLWKEDLLRGLMWRTAGTVSSFVYRPPSWSWTTLDTGVAHDAWVLDIRTFCAEVLEARAVVRGLNPYGQVASGKVTILGSIAPVPSVVFEQATYDNIPGTYLVKSTLWMYPVVQWDRQVAPSIDSICLRMTLDHGLILAPVKKPSCPDLYTRVGFVQSTHKLRRMKADPNLLDKLEWRVAVVTII